MMKYNAILNSVAPSASMKIGLGAVGESYTNFAIGAPDIDPPLDVTEIISRRVATARHPYTATVGTVRARENMATILSDEHFQVPADNIILIEGAKYGIYLALKAVCRRGARVMMIEPYWLSYPNMTASLDLENVFYTPKNTDGVLSTDLDHLVGQAVSENADVVIINNPNNPSGQILTFAEITSLAIALKKVDKWLLIDEVYKELIFDRRGDFSFNVRGENVIRVGSFSKSLCIPGLRLGYMYGEPEVLKQIVLLGQHIETCLNTYALAVAESISVNTLRTHAKMCADIYRERYNALKACLSATKLSMLKCDSSFYAFVDFSAYAATGSEACSLLANKYKILVTPGHEYGNSFSSYVRICLTLPKEQITKKFKEVIDGGF